MKTRKLYKTRPFKNNHKNHPNNRLKWVAISLLIIVFCVTLIVFLIKNHNGSNSGNNPAPEPETGDPDNSSVEPESTKSSIPNSIELRSGGQLYRVSRVVDGDTIDVIYDNQQIRIRLIGINTPETVHPSKPQECFGQEASNRLKALLSGKSVAIELDASQDKVDDYGRILAYVYVDNRMANYAMIYDGYAYEYTYNVPYKYQSEFKAAQRDADVNNRGLWSPSTCNGQK